MATLKARSTELPLISTKHFTEPIEISLAAYSDLHDLLAVVTSGEQDVVVFRLHGQEIYRISRGDGEGGVCAVKWKGDGSLLGVGWGSGGMGIYRGEDGAVVRVASGSSPNGDPIGGDDIGWRLDLEATQAGDVATSWGVEVLGWTAYSSSTKSEVQSGWQFSGEREDESTAETAYGGYAADLLPENGQVKPAARISELIKSIATFDATTVLPRLSALPTHALRFSTDEQKSANQGLIDAIFDMTRSDPGTVDTLITSGRSGTTTVYLDDSVRIGEFNLGDQSSYCWHASHPHSASQAILAAGADNVARLHYIDLPLETLSGSLLHVVATNTKRMQNLVTYVIQTVRCLQSDFVTGQTLPNRLMEALREELSEKAELDDPTSSLYRLAMTGTFTPTILEWLTERVRENNHKRWDKAVNDLYHHIQTHLFIHLIPALDRLSIAASAIRGYARMYGESRKFVTSAPFDVLLEDIDSVKLLAQKLLLLVGSEHRQFRAFSKWLRVQIDIAVAGPRTKSAIETEEREVPSLDYGLLLGYIKETLHRSKLAPYLEQISELRGSCSKEEFFRHPLIAQLNRENVAKVLDNLDTESTTTKTILNLPALTSRLAAQTRTVLESVTRWQTGTLSAPTTTSLNTLAHTTTPDSTILDLRMSAPSSKQTHVESITHILHKAASHNQQVRLSLLKISRLYSAGFESARLDIDLKGTALIHAKMVDERNCLILAKTSDGGEYVLYLCDWKERDGAISSSASNSLELAAEKGLRVLHIFDNGKGFEPGYFVVGGRPRKMVCVVFERKGREYRVFDLSGSSEVAVQVKKEDEMET